MGKSVVIVGGEIHYKSRVKDLIIENDQALGVRLEDGTEHRADLVVWAGDGHTVIYDILGGRYLDDEVRSMYSDWTPVGSPVHVMLGIARELSKEPHRIIFEAENPITIAGEEHRWLSFQHRCFDPSMAPPGSSVAEVWYATPYEYWEELARDRVRYKEEKKRKQKEGLPPVPIGTNLDAAERRRLFGRLDILLGGWPQDAPHMYPLASPTAHVHPGCPPTLLIQGSQDSFVPVDATCAHYTKLVESGVPAINVVFPWTDHAFDLLVPQIAPTAQSALYDVDRFLALSLNRD